MYLKNLYLGKYLLNSPVCNIERRTGSPITNQADLAIVTKVGLRVSPTATYFDPSNGAPLYLL